MVLKESLIVNEFNFRFYYYSFVVVNFLCILILVGEIRIWERKD